MSKISDFFYKLGDLLPFKNRQWFSVKVGYKGEVWINTEKPTEAYYEIPQLMMVVDRLAAMFANGEIIIKRGNEIVENHPALKTLKEPNYYQTQNEFYEMGFKHYAVFGNAYEYFNMPSSFKIENRHFISPYYIKPELTGKLFKQTDIKGAVKQYFYTDTTSNKETLETDRVIHFANSDINNPLIGVSKIHTLKYPLSNIKGAYAYSNTILTNKGPITMISSKEGSGENVMGAKEQMDLERQFTKEYGTGENQIPVKISQAAVDVHNMSYPVREMMLIEEKQEGLKDICNIYGANSNLFLPQSTYANLAVGITSTYRDAVFPIADMISQGETKKLKQLGFLAENETFEFSYNHIDILKTEALNNKMSATQMINAINQAVTLGLITPEQVQPIIVDLLR